ncbi:MAG: B12-binding domain-containing radical SAM protein, partial [Terriglobia bacterium]
MNALLIYPEWPDTYWSFKHALPFEGKRSAYPPLGLLTIAPLLPKHWKKRMVDTNVRRLTDADLEWADVALLSGMLVHKQHLLALLARCRARGLRTVVGGPVTSSVEELPRHADHVVVGEAEDLIAGLAADLEQGTAKPLYHARALPGLDTTPLPDLSLINLKYYSASGIQYSRGCPFNCEFCDIIEIYGRKPRTKSPAQVTAELEQLYERNWRGSVFIVDDNFIGNKKKVKELLPVLVEWNARHQRPFTFFTEASVNLADDVELLQLMKDSGFTRVFLGIETPVEASLKEAQKLQNTRRSLLDSVHRIQGYGMEVMAGFIVGFDNDPEDIFDKQVE